MKLRVGVIGIGESWEKRHRRALHTLGDRFEVRAVTAEVAHLAEQAAHEFGAVAVDGYRALARREDIDAVLLLAPDWYGHLPILAACEAGKAIYSVSALDLEPPIASQVKQRVEQSGVAFMAEFPRRQAPATLRLKELIATQLGAPKLLFCHDRLRQEEVNGRVGRSGCPTPMRTIMELIDWCSYVVGGSPTSVVGVAHEASEKGEVDYQMMSLDFSPGDEVGKGPLAQISCGAYIADSWPEAFGFRPPSELQVCCENGVAFVDLPTSLVWFDSAGRHLESLESDRPVGEQLLTQFHRAVTSLVRCTGDLEDAYRALHAMLAAKTSSREGRRVRLE